MGSLSSSRQQQGGENFASSQQNAFNQQVSNQGAQSTQGVWGAQQPGLEQLFATGQSILGGGGVAPGMQGVANQAQQAWGQALQPGGNPYFSASMQAAIDQATRGWREDVMPTLTDQGVAVGGFGEPRHQLALSSAAQGFGRDLGQLATQGYAQQYAADQASRLQALGMTGAMQGAQAAPLSLAQQLIGGPTVLGQSSSFGNSMGVGGSSGASNAGGWSSGTGRSMGMGFLGKGG